MVTTRIDWTPARKAELMDLVEKYGKHWESIAMRMNLGKHKANTIKHRYYMIVESRKWNDDKKFRNV